MRRVQDVWLAIRMARGAWIKGIALGFPVLAALALVTYQGPLLARYLPVSTFAVLRALQDPFWFKFVTGSFLLGLHLVVGRLFWVYAQGVGCDLDTRQLSWPASDLENGLVDILTVKRLRGHLHLETCPLDGLRDVTNDDAGRFDRIFRLNVTGTFGSRQLEFSSKQKRDECRVLMLEAARRCGILITTDINFAGSPSA